MPYAADSSNFFLSQRRRGAVQVSPLIYINEYLPPDSLLAPCPMPLAFKPLEPLRPPEPL